MNQQKKLSINQDMEVKARSMLANYAQSDASSTYSSSRRFKKSYYNQNQAAPGTTHRRENLNIDNNNGMGGIGNSYYSTTNKDSPVHSPNNRSHSSVILSNIRNALTSIVPGMGKTDQAKRLTSLDPFKPDMTSIIGHIQDLRSIIERYEARIATLESKYGQQNECLSRVLDQQTESQKKFSEIDIKLLQLDVAHKIVSSHFTMTQQQLQKQKNSEQIPLRSDTPGFIPNEQDISVEIKENNNATDKIKEYQGHSANSDKKRKVHIYNNQSIDDYQNSLSTIKFEKSGHKESQTYKIHQKSGVSIFSPVNDLKKQNSMNVAMNTSKDKYKIFFQQVDSASKQSSIEKDEDGRRSLSQGKLIEMLDEKDGLSGIYDNQEYRMENLVAGISINDKKLSLNEEKLSNTALMIEEMIARDNEEQYQQMKRGSKTQQVNMNKFNAEEIDYLLHNDSQVSLDSPTKMRQSVGMNLVPLDIELADLSDMQSINFATSNYKLQRINEVTSEQNSFMEDDELSKEPMFSPKGGQKLDFGGNNKSGKKAQVLDAKKQNQFKPRNTVQNYHAYQNEKDPKLPVPRRTVDEGEVFRQNLVKMLKINNPRIKRMAINGGWVIDFCNNQKLDPKIFEKNAIKDFKVLQTRPKKQKDSKVKEYSLDQSSNKLNQKDNIENLNNIYKNLFVENKTAIQNQNLLSNNQISSELDVNKDFFVIGENVWKLIVSQGYDYDMEIVLC